jgi:preprotein translocase subunit SecD
VDISSDLRSIAVAPGPVGPCDSVYVGRGLVLTFRSAIDARSVTVTVTAPMSSSPARPSSSPSAAITHRAVSLRLVPADGHAPTVAELQAVATVLLERVSIYGGSTGASFPGQGTDQVTVAVDVPAGDAGYLDRVTATLTAPGQVRFVPLGPGGGEPGQTVAPTLAPLFGGDAVTDVAFGSDQTGARTLDIVLSPSATEAFAHWSEANVGAGFAITIDGRIELAPIIQSPVTDGHLVLAPAAVGPEDIDRLAAVLRSGPLPVPVVLVPSQP